MKADLVEKFRVAKRLFRHFPYSEYLFYFLPFFAILFSEGFIESLSSVFLLFPFLVSYAVIFVYNDLCDVGDGSDRNPLAGKRDLQNFAWMILGTLIVLCLFSFFLLYRNSFSQLLFVVYFVVGLAYSGLKVRFKETVVGVFVAGFLSRLGGPLIFVAEYEAFTSVTLVLLGAMFLFGVSREVEHTIIDYSDDLSNGVKTFTVLLGRAAGFFVKYMFLLGSFGLILIVLGLYSFVDSLLMLSWSWMLGVEKGLVQVD